MKSKILFVLSLLFALMFINAGLNKFLHYIPVPADLPKPMVKLTNDFMEIGWLMPLIGMVEIIGGILFIFRKTRAFGAIIIFPIMIGILFTHFIAEPSGLPIVLPLFAILLWVMVENKEKYLPMVR